jgi:predicted transcriptional regulator
MELAEKLEKIGLTKGEAKVYLALLSGKSTKSQIVKNSGVSSSVVYEILEKLIKKGLASFVVLEGKRYFQVCNPEKLFEFIKKEKEIIKRKENLAKEIIPLLKQRKNEFLLASVYQGLDGLKSLLKEVEGELEKGRVKEWLTIGVTAYKNQAFNRFWVKWHSKVRPKYKVKSKFIFSEKSIYSKALSKTPLSKAEYIPLKNPSCITIVGERVLIMKYTTQPSFISLKSKELARTFEEIFKILWNLKND